MQNNTDKKKRKKIVVIGGGTGVFTALSGLRKFPLDLTAIISMADDGGSTGILREEFGILPPGDVRRALISLAHTDAQFLSNLFNYRFEQGGLNGHVFGNIMLTALERMTGSFEKALEEAGKLLHIQGRVIPVTLDRVRLCAILEDGSIVRGETNIDIPKHDPLLRIRTVYLEPRAHANKSAVKAIRSADLVVIGPGDLYTSIIPNLLVHGISSTIKNSKAKKAFVVNTMTKNGETGGFTARDFVNEIERYLDRSVLDYILVNTKKPSPERVEEYEEEGKRMVDFEDLSSDPRIVKGDFIRKAGFVRHDPELFAQAIVSLA